MTEVFMVEFRCKGRRGEGFTVREFFSTEEKAEAFRATLETTEAWVTVEVVQ